MKALRILFRTVAALLAALLLILVALIVSGYGLATKRQSNPVPDLRVVPDSALIARGRHLSEIHCASCHSPDRQLPMSGGVENQLGPPFGALYAPNLTPAGRLRSYSDGELARAIREGVNREGRAMVVMPSASFHALSDRDLSALIAYMRSQPRVERVVGSRKMSPVAYLVLGLHLYETSVQLPVARPVPDVPPDSTPAYGAYLVSTLGCRDCHGESLRGGRKGQLPPLGPDLIGPAHGQSQPAFELALRQGIGSRGEPLDPMRMPWPAFSRLTDLEVTAIHQYLRSLP